MQRINISFLEGVLCIAVSSRFMFDPLAAMILALGGLLTLFQNPLRDNSLPRTLTITKGVFGAGALLAASVILLAGLFSQGSSAGSATLTTMK